MDLICDMTDFFTWDAVPGAASYDFEVMHEGTGAPLALMNVTEPRLLVGAIISGPAFETMDRGSLMVHVRGRDVLGPGEWSCNQPIYVNPPAQVAGVVIESA